MKKIVVAIAFIFCGSQAWAEEEGMMLAGTRFTFGGFIDFDMHLTGLSAGSFVDSGSIVRDIYIPGATQIGGQKSTTFDFVAQGTRFWVGADREVGDVKIMGRIEMDFLGSGQGNERVTNSFSPRLRHAYVDVAGFRIGQTWTTFMNTSAIPESASFLILSDGMVFIRQPVLRYTWNNWQFALENGLTTVTGHDGNRVTSDTQYIPDIVARYNMKGNFGNISVSGIMRYLRSGGGDAFGVGASASGRVKVLGSNDVRFNIFAGQGLGRYTGLNSMNAASLDAEDKLLAVISYGGLFSYRHALTEQARLSVGYSIQGVSYHNDSVFEDGVSPTSMVHSGFMALLWNPLPKLSIGPEFMYGERREKGGEKGQIWRLSFSTKYSF